MTPEQQKEELSRAYLHAVAAACGYAIGGYTQDQKCIDASIMAGGSLGGGELSDPEFHVQLKCTSDPRTLTGTHVAWQLKRSHYEHLTARSTKPKVLVILVLPVDTTPWVEHTADALILRRCAYYLVMAGQPPLEPGVESRVVHVPFANVFSPTNLKNIMEKLSRGESL